MSTNIYHFSSEEAPTTNILKENTVITKDQYDQEKINREYNELYMKSTQATQKEQKKKESQRIYNLSIKQIAIRASEVYINILNELTILINKKQLDIKSIVNIISVNDRLMYVGLLLVVLSLFLAFVFISN